MVRSGSMICRLKGGTIIHANYAEYLIRHWFIHGSSCWPWKSRRTRDNKQLFLIRLFQV